MSLAEVAAKLKTEFPYVTVESLNKISKKTKLEDSSPLVELNKLSSLIKSNTTKLGIISCPDKLGKNEAAFKKQVVDLMNVMFYLLSLVPLFHDASFADYFTTKFDNEVISLILSVHKLSDELIEIIELGSGSESNDYETKEDAPADERLISIGMIWSQCDNLHILSSQGNMGLLSEHISSSIKLLQDSIEEINEWLQDPVISADPFGINDSYSDEGNEPDNYDEEEAPESMINFVQTLLQKSKLLKLLLSSLSKSIDIKKDTASTSEYLSELNKLHRSIVSNSDEMISNTLIQKDYETDPEIENSSLAIDKDVKRIIKIITQLNHANEPKLKWIQVWSKKWNEL